MRGWTLACAGLAAAFLPAVLAMAQNLPPRVLYWHPANAQAEEIFLAMWAPFRKGCEERDLELRRVEKPTDRHRLGIPADESQMVLVGRDGLIKRRWSFDAVPQEVFTAIDAMPMRQREIEGGQRPR
ncbi:MAG: DUF4174 domain-containing protein [Terrimicrobiaceae bacterium]|nr:DUF4174 domain-containing protein [Terrimicrobiaceae bacterium]